jgi:hypothetical protein
MAYSARPLLSKSPRLRQLLVQFPLQRKLQHQEYPLRIVEMVIQPDDVGVSTTHSATWCVAQNKGSPQVLLDLNLPSDLLLHASRYDFLLVQAFQGEDEFVLSLRTAQVYSSELPLAERSANVQIR